MITWLLREAPQLTHEQACQRLSVRCTVMPCDRKAVPGMAGAVEALLAGTEGKVVPTTAPPAMTAVPGVTGTALPFSTGAPGRVPAAVVPAGGEVPAGLGLPGVARLVLTGVGEAVLPVLPVELPAGLVVAAGDAGVLVLTGEGEAVLPALPVELPAGVAGLAGDAGVLGLAGLVLTGEPVLPVELPAGLVVAAGDAGVLGVEPG